MPLQQRAGDVFESPAEAIAHGCNLAGVMGAGIAKEFALRYPMMYQVYRGRCSSQQLQLGEVFAWKEHGHNRTILNLMTQVKPGPDASNAAVQVAITNMIRYAEANGIKTIAMPQIGCGIGGLSWKQVKSILLRAFDKTEVIGIVYEFK